jgi:L-amino acid N-acyltransferase YncA
MELREAIESDLPGILKIYNEVIATTTAVYAEKPATLEDREAWFQARQATGYPVLIAEDENGVAGFATFGDFRAFPCYRYTVDHSVHIRSDCRGQGLGRSLMDALILRAGSMGMHVLIAAIDASNEGSIDFHRRLGFENVATLREVGRKFDRWLDLVFMQRFLDGAGAPRPSTKR